MVIITGLAAMLFMIGYALIGVTMIGTANYLAGPACWSLTPWGRKRFPGIRLAQPERSAGGIL